MLDGFLNLILGLFGLFKYPIYFVVGVLVFVYLIVAIDLFVLHRQGFRFKKGKHRPQKKISILKRLFIMLPKMIAKDIITKDPDFFKYQGLIIYEGRQGNGKTIGAIEHIRRMQVEYPLCKVMTNLAYKYEDEELTTWQDMVGYNNGIHGVVVFIDETQNWFSSNDSKNFPPGMLSEITQNRKQRRIIVGTSQCFKRLAKPIREQTTEVRKCSTFLGALTIIRRYEPFLNSEGDVEEYKCRGMYFFVHTEEIRSLYDTWNIIKRMEKVGFQENNYLLENGVVVKLQK